MDEEPNMSAASSKKRQRDTAHQIKESRRFLSDLQNGFNKSQSEMNRLEEDIGLVNTRLVAAEAQHDVSKIRGHVANADDIAIEDALANNIREIIVSLLALDRKIKNSKNTGALALFVDPEAEEAQQREREERARLAKERRKIDTISVNLNNEEPADDVCTFRMHDALTFGELKKMAARYFDIPYNDAMLTDDSGHQFPKKMSVMQELEKHDKNPRLCIYVKPKMLDVPVDIMNYISDLGEKDETQEVQSRINNMIDKEDSDTDDMAEVKQTPTQRSGEWYEIVFFFLFAGCVLTIILLRANIDSAFYLSNAIQSALETKNFSFLDEPLINNTAIGYPLQHSSASTNSDGLSGTYLSTPSSNAFNTYTYDYHYAKSLTDITDDLEFWLYMKKALPEVMFPQWLYPGFSTTNYAPPRTTFMNELLMHYNVPLGLYRIKQNRVQASSCTTFFNSKSYTGTCYPAYTSSSSSNAAFSATQTTLTTDSECGLGSASNNPFTYLSPSYGSTVTGFVANYESAGYFYDFTPTSSTYKTMIGCLCANNWVDEQTRAVMLLFNTYNPGVDWLSVGRILFEFAPGGGVVPSVKVYSIRLSYWADWFLAGQVSEAFTMILEILVALSLILLGYWLHRKIKEGTNPTDEKIKPRKWFWILFEFWNMLDVCIMLMYFGVLLVEIIFVTSSLRTTFDITNTTQYIDYSPLSNLQTAIIVLYGLLAILATVKLFKFMMLSERAHLLWCSLHKALRTMFWFLVLFMLFILGFAFLGFLSFGSTVYRYSTFGNSVWALLRLIVGDFSYTEIERDNYFLGPVYFTFYAFLVLFIMVTGFTAILIHSNNEIQKKNKYRRITARFEDDPSAIPTKEELQGLPWYIRKKYQTKLQLIQEKAMKKKRYDVDHNEILDDDDEENSPRNSEH
eukprot:gnl/Hemi2/10392_TR3584_c0_g1_i1.p1 gnl/Hemi2/10392_TR3584_c0_g1~~gnl/Hemi2/10392_TR3584_c0_g1_i1.p1  ORF type:complete len:909 (-),score=357.18 gnl/Hemi2/10392_TR3584_c0_g1_i1:37-2763(-)